MKKSPFTVFGIRHHGPGSAGNLIRSLDEMKPDYLLIEGPPDADEYIGLAGREDMNPPVALLIYDGQNPLRSVFYPFAEFSPEWQAMRFALKRNIPVQFMDLPQRHQLALSQEQTADAPSSGTESPVPETVETQEERAEEPSDSPTGDRPDPADPLDWFARHAGYEDGEAWWEHAVEERLDSGELFRAIADVMTGLREQFPSLYSGDERLREQRREAWMRKTIRVAEKQGYENIAVVCGAWHVPALVADAKVKDDNELLRGLPKIRVETTWIPWTYGRLARRSGYGAGISAPGWYEHLWHHRREDTGQTPSLLATRWFIRVAELLRKADLDASTAHIIDAVRLAESLAAMRQRPFPGLEELNDATQSVLCFGDRSPMIFIRDRLLIGERMGSTPADTPKVPLQTDLEKQQRSLRLKPSADTEEIDLDLRTPNGLARSHLLHRLNLLNIPWGKQVQGGYGKKGTFHEYWHIKWQPEFVVTVIEAAMWGTTVELAATAKAVHTAKKTESIAELAGLINAVLLSELPATVDPVVSALRSRSAQTNDVTGLMQALPSLVTILRYGNVRQSDSAMVGEVVDGLIARICIGLQPACQSLDEDAAQSMNGKITAANHAVFLLENEAHRGAWTAALRGILSSDTINALVRGKVCRLLFDKNEIEREETARLMSLAVSPGNETAMAAAWVQGFLEGSGMILFHDSNLWDVLDAWVCELPSDRFTELLPLMRRTFSTFSPPERQQLGSRVKTRQKTSTRTAAHAHGKTGHFNKEWGDRAVTEAAKLLGL
ncbi:MAG: DUF5682 family protein [Desulfococcaceae bacterium]